MELITAALIIYAVIKDVLFYKEREKLQMKLMSKDLTEYVDATEPEAEDTPQEENPEIPIEEATVEQVLKAKDRL